MFVSQFSGKQYGAGITPMRLVIEKRAKNYTVKDKYGGEFTIGQGWEIVREIVCGPDEVEAVQAKYPAPSPTPTAMGFQFKKAWSDDDKRGRNKESRYDRDDYEGKNRGKRNWD